MDWTDEILKEVTDFASLPSFTPKMIAVALGIDRLTFLSEIQKEGTTLNIAYERGKLMAQAEFDKRVQTLSKQGSGPAQTLELKMRREANVNKLLENYG
jgi:GTP1/Obg family GTP-binding protein